jgi:hypothetical protein
VSNFQAFGGNTGWPTQCFFQSMTGCSGFIEMVLGGQLKRMLSGVERTSNGRLDRLARSQMTPTGHYLHLPARFI